MSTLFETSDYNVQPRSLNGRFSTKQHKSDLDRLRLCVMAELRRNKAFSSIIRSKDEEIICLKQKLANFAENDRLSNLF